MDLGLDGRVAIVTGGSRGIGRGIAEAFADERMRVAITYHSDRGRAEAVAAGLRQKGGDACAVFFDLGSDESIGAAVGAVLQCWGRIDVLVNNAVEHGGRTIRQAPPFERLPAEEWRHLLRSNIEGAYAAIQAVLPSMREQQFGRIVNISAVFAADGMRGAAWYTSAKAALHGLTRSLAREVGVDGILVNVVMPGLTLTEGALERVPESVREENARATAIGRLLTPEDLARTVVFLCSAANTAITGEIIRASGGFLTPHQPRRVVTDAAILAPLGLRETP